MTPIEQLCDAYCQTRRMLDVPINYTHFARFVRAARLDTLPGQTQSESWGYCLARARKYIAIWLADEDAQIRATYKATPQVA